MSASRIDREASPALRQALIPVIAYSFIFTLLFFIPNLLPLYTGILIDVGGLSPSHAGAVNSTYLGTMAVAAIGATFLISRMTPRTLAYIATILQALGFVIALFIGGNESVFIGMAIAGLGNGALFAVANAAGALEKHPVLVFGAGMVLSNVVSAAVPPPLYAAVEAFGLGGLFITPLAVIPVILVSLLVLPKKVVTEVVSTDELQESRSTSVKRSGALLLIGIFLTNLFVMVYYAFADRLLVRAGFDFDAISIIFTIVYLAAAVSGVIAMVMARWPRRLALNLVVVTALLAGSTVAALLLELPSGVVIAVNIAAMLSMLGMAIGPAVAAQIDVTGRLSAAASGALISSMAIGPILGGWLLESVGFTGIAILTIVLGAGALVALGLVYLKLRPKAEASVPTVPQFG
ncbi:MFS transporter [Paenarthrobacter sp. NPDC058040]|uniref:MFS transporter n=1 Tax=unclassified Paenarthrobacter TaxID=2634190 RepID=UPI0036DF8A73